MSFSSIFELPSKKSRNRVLQMMAKCDTCLLYFVRCLWATTETTDRDKSLFRTIGRVALSRVPEILPEVIIFFLHNFIILLIQYCSN